MSRVNRTVIVCNRCGDEEPTDFVTPSEKAPLPEGWRAFSHPNPNVQTEVTFDRNYCAEAWFNQQVREAFDADFPTAEREPVPAAALTVDDIPF